MFVPHWEWRLICQHFLWHPSWDHQHGSFSFQLFPSTTVIITIVTITWGDIKSIPQHFQILLFQLTEILQWFILVNVPSYRSWHSEFVCVIVSLPNDSRNQWDNNRSQWYFFSDCGNTKQAFYHPSQSAEEDLISPFFRSQRAQSLTQITESYQQQLEGMLFLSIRVELSYKYWTDKYLLSSLSLT